MATEIYIPSIPAYIKKYSTSEIFIVLRQPFMFKPKFHNKKNHYITNVYNKNGKFGEEVLLFVKL